MKYDCLIFDLDGTISDPKEGVVKSLNYALSAHGFDQQEASFLSTFIGPPLDKTFEKIVHSDDKELIASLVSKYRERYADVGFSENLLYDNMSSVLNQLASQPNLKLGVCTSKRVDFAERILELFELKELFDFINGGEIGIEKWQQLASLKQEEKISGNSLMIGDRYVDLMAAHKNGLTSAAVLWGYGPPAELIELNPAYVLSSPNELLGFIE